MQNLSDSYTFIDGGLPPSIFPQKASPREIGSPALSFSAPSSPRDLKRSNNAIVLPPVVPEGISPSSPKYLYFLEREIHDLQLTNVKLKGKVSLLKIENSTVFSITKNQNTKIIELQKKIIDKQEEFNNKETALKITIDDLEKRVQKMEKVATVVCSIATASLGFALFVTVGIRNILSLFSKPISWLMR